MFDLEFLACLLPRSSQLDVTFNKRTRMFRGTANSTDSMANVTVCDQPPEKRRTPAARFGGNVPQSLTDPVTVVFATPRESRGGGKAGGKGMKGASAATVFAARKAKASAGVVVAFLWCLVG